MTGQELVEQQQFWNRNQRPTSFAVEPFFCGSLTVFLINCSKVFKSSSISKLASTMGSGKLGGGCTETRALPSRGKKIIHECADYSHSLNWLVSLKPVLFSTLSYFYDL